MFRSTMKIWDSKKWLKQADFIPFRQGNKLNWKDKGIWAWTSKLVKKWQCLYNLLSPEFSVSGDKDAFYPHGNRGGTFYMGDLFSAFRGTRQFQSTLLALTVS